MMTRWMLYLTIFLVVTAAARYGWKLTARNAYENAEYRVIKADGPFEIRQYPDLRMATTPMKPAGQRDDGSFMRLFRYIDGDNANKEKVAMTTPVFMEPADQAKPGQMGFVLPKEVAERGAPEPRQGDVTLRTRPGGRFAVIRFAGRLDRESVAKAESRLRSWIEKENLAADASAEWAGYDPPWTPGPLRRNEVLIRVK